MDLIKKIHGYLSEDIEAMNAIIVASLAVDEDLIQLISNHLASAGGKRMRPILTILTAKMYGYEGENAIKLAAAVEFYLFFAISGLAYFVFRHRTQRLRLF